MANVPRGPYKKRKRKRYRNVTRVTTITAHEKKKQKI